VAAVVRWQVALAGLLIAVPAAVVASFVPYRSWDAMAFGLWSKLIAQTGDLFPGGLSPAILHRPLFYVAQGLAWRWIDDGEWVGRWLSLLFAAVLVVALAWVAGRLCADRVAATVVRPLAASVALASSVIAVYLVSGLSDLPVAAGAALTAAALLARPRRVAGPACIAAAAAATVLAKPSGIVALAGVAAAGAVLLQEERGRLARGLAAVGAGVVAGLAYNVVQAHRLGISLADELSTGNDRYWLDRAAAARVDAVLRAEWLGAGARLAVLAGIALAVARAAGAGPRLGVGIAGPFAVAASLLGPTAAGDGLPYPLDGGGALAVSAWIVLAAALLAAPLLDPVDPLSRRAHLALLAWLVPGSAAWLAFRSDEVRLLSPAWPPLVLVAAAALGAAALTLARVRPWLVLAPAAALTLAVAANVSSIDGLGSPGWRELADAGPSAWTDRAAMENFAYGPFGDELALVRRTAGPSGSIVSSDARLPYFFPGRSRVRYPVSCADLAGADAFVLLLGDESVAFMERAGGTADPLAWEQCAAPHLYSVGTHDGIYAAYAVGRRPARAPTAADCRVTTSPGSLLDGVFVEDASYAVARDVRARAAAVGYTVARIERTGCGRYRVVVTGIPTPEANQAEFLRESAGAGFATVVRPALRYPEVAADAEAAPASR
jgi:hypothetical protein